MIDWDRTQKIFNVVRPKYRSRIAVICDECGGAGDIILTRVSDIVNGQMKWRCKECGHKATNAKLKQICNTPEKKAQLSAQSKKTWQDPSMRDRILEAKQAVQAQISAKQSDTMKKRWEDPEFRAKWEESLNTPETRAKLSEASRLRWEDDEYRNGMIELFKTRSKELWQNPDYRDKVLRGLIGNVKLSEALKARWRSSEYAAHMIRLHKALWNTPEYRTKMLDIIHANTATPEFSEKMRAISLAAWRNPAYRDVQIEHLRDTMLARWQDPVFQAKMEILQRSDEYRTQISNAMVEVWRDPEYRDRMTSIHNSVEFRDSASRLSKSLWMDPTFRASAIALRRSSEFKSKMSTIFKALWADPEYANKILSTHRDDGFIDKISSIVKERWRDIEYRNKISTIVKNRWRDAEYRDRMAQYRANQPRVSSLQTTLYSILDDLKVEYFREYPDKPADAECTIGPYNFDCVIPRVGRPTLLIECQGEYWHSIQENRDRDKSKASYIAQNFPGQYELKCIWEHEFKNHNKVVELLKYWLGITAMEVVDFDFTHAAIRPCPAEDYKLLLSKYHYLSTGGRGGIAYGAYLGDELIAVCIFSPLIRQNIKIDDFKSDEVRELSRLCIHPRYQKKNFTSWFVSRCLKMLPTQYKCIISYCDTTFNHDGAIYKACNFALDGTVPPDYWYVSADGWVMHKRTLYGHARLMKMTEAQYAESMGYMKAYGSEKLRFKYIR